MKNLFIPLKTEYYEAFADGSKKAELRLYGARWNEKTCVVGRAVTLSKGYGKKHRLTGVIKGFAKKSPYLLPEEAKQAFYDCYGTLEEDVAIITIAI